MPTVPKAGLVKPEDTLDNTSNSRTFLPSPVDRSESESKEGRTRRKLQKTQSESSKSFRRPVTNGASVGNNAQETSSPVQRRPSIRTQKPLIGARPLTRSPSKATPQDATSKSRSTSFSSKFISRSRQSSAMEPPKLAKGDTQGEAAPSREEESLPISFLPEVNFDDLHSSITSDLNLYDLAASDTSLNTSVQPRNKPPTSNGIKAFQAATAEKKEPGETRISRSNSFQRRQQELAQKPINHQPKNPALVAANMSAARARRQSQLTSSMTSNNLPRAPRKSIGPGVIPQGSSEYSFLRRGSATSTTMQIRSPSDSSYSIDNASNFFNNGRSPASTTEDTSFASLRTGQPRTSQSSRKSGIVMLSSSYDSPDQTASSARSPLRHSTVGTPNSTASNKRASMMPGHATGLGARTISPTDARRMRRMSMMPTAPPVPQTPPTSAPEGPGQETRSVFDIPIQVPRKLDTPSSSRTTPDPNRKSVTSIMSAASTTSVSSTRASNQAAAARSNAGASTSRLPTLKGRNEAPSTDSGEYVPPVPAIPKAYESPKNEQDIQFQYPVRKPSQQFDASRSTSVSTAEFTSAASTYSSDKETPKAPKEERKPVRMALFPTIDQDERASGAQDGRRTLQPFKLPPLSIVPIKTPTNEQVAALAAQRSAEGSGPSTPPAKKHTNKIPSTPMTASRANFFTRHTHKDDNNTTALDLRSSSSHYNLKSDAAFRMASSSTTDLPDPSDLQPPRKAVSPFTSASLPKSQNDFGSVKSVGGDRTPASFTTETRPHKPTGPRALTSKSSKVDPDTSGAFTDGETNSFGSALRRKLSMTRRRSSSKNEGERPPPPPDHEMMPPPRLPASATWNNLTQKSGSPTTKPSYLHSRRKSAHVDALANNAKSSGGRVGEMPKDAASISTVDSLVSNSSDTLISTPSIRAVSSSIPAAPRMYSLSNSRQPARLQALDITLDRDDLTAEEEMKRLAMKRKKTEIEARELDELRARAVPRDSVTPAQALRAARLNLFERGEIVDYQEIYFCGTQSAHKLEGNAESSATNFGYDDERGDYNIVLGDHLAYRYEVVDLLGKGSFGQVVRCVDHKTGGLVAIKIIRNKKRFHQQALVEVNILQKLREWDPESKFSMVSFTAHFYFRGHLCISTELLGMNLYEFIKLHDFKGFSLKLIRRFTKQMLNSLLLLQSRKIIHCDLKPENILLAHPAQSHIKVIDFGSSCHENERVYTYIQSRFYRSPEVILGMTYGMPIDMWSVGCILAELLTGYPIFPGENEQEQLACIMEIFGPPDKALIEKATRKKLFFDSLGKPRLTVSSKGKRRRPSSKTLQQALKCDDEAFLDFLTKCLRWDPERRLKPDEAIHHEFITGIKTSTTRSSRTIIQGTASVNNSPMKRFNSIHISSTTRPLPDPPALKSSATTGRIREPAISPVKSGAKNYSTAPNITNGVASARKRSAMSTTGTLPKTGGVVSSRTDLASAAAAVATTRTR